MVEPDGRGSPASQRAPALPGLRSDGGATREGSASGGARRRVGKNTELAAFPRNAEAPPSERNALLYIFTGPDCCSAVDNRADQRAAMVAQLRAAYGHHVGDPAWTGFIRRMEAASPEFAAMWATQDVAQPAYYAKVFRHPLYPRLEMTSISFAVQAAPGTRLVVYTPDTEATRTAMERIVADPDQHRFPCWPAHQARTRDLLTI